MKVLAWTALLFIPALAQGQSAPETGVIAGGTEWETPYYVADSGEPGPTVLITGGIHGNEPAGAAAAAQIRHWPIKSGRLAVIPRANQQGLAAKEREMPGQPAEHADLNRNFPKSGKPDQAETELGQAIWAFAKELRPDWVLDLHEGIAIHRQNPDSAGSTILCRPDETTRPIFERALAAVNASIEDPDSHFMMKSRSKTANGTLARAAMERLGATSAILETTYSGIPLAVRIRQHRLMVNRILRDLGMVSAGPDDLVFRAEGDTETIWIAIYQDRGVGGNGPNAMRADFAALPGFETRTIGASEVQGGALDQFDAVIFPGGSGSKQAAGLGEAGREKVRAFVAGGGAYLGICAGCYLACENFSWSLKILDAKTRSSKWERGKAVLDLGFEGGAESLFGLDAKVEVRYQNGPVMEPAHSPDIPDFETIAVFGSEVAKNGTPKGLQVGTPAILRGTFGNGRAVGISPHPEQTDGLRQIVPTLVKWAVGRE